MNSNNKPCDADGNKLVFANSVDTSASDGGYLDLDLDADADADANADVDVDADAGPAIELEKWIINAIELRIRKNNVLVAARIVKKGAKKA